ncbi:HpcH/HpaI aldolase/citrate lyase family protein [Notoacmeibacter ruber]|uniref:CoA ester lyase n=1 Tax=Notoacmeibacter ruber TaxID=2670375 RepID=A0A3L7JB92_9HYPH|nr:CoA ester lyase [Notoacmeibacter ruber]RLQ87913.1 CoA ester lyase [Notoacmeibacter ruber]
MIDETRLLNNLSFPLFVPATRPERLAKAFAAGADTVIMDLEDAVSPDKKSDARRLPEGAVSKHRSGQFLLRVNAHSTQWYEDDVAFAAQAGFDGVVLPKAEDSRTVEALRETLGEGRMIIALVETVHALSEIDAIARLSDRLAFGSIDFAEDMGCAHNQTALLPIRSRIVQAARLAERPAPLDGVTTSTKEAELVRRDAAHASEMGFGGKLLIHPMQIEPSRGAFRPDAESIAWAERVLAGGGTEDARSVDGAMVDAPVVARARRIVQRAKDLS